MCYTCGCGLPYNDHHDPRNITESNFASATKTSAFKKHSHGGKTTAKRNALELLHLEQHAHELDHPKTSYKV